MSMFRNLLMEKKSGGLRNLQIGDDISNKTFYFTFPETQTFINELTSYYAYNTSQGGFVQKRTFINVTTDESDFNNCFGFSVFVYKTTNRVVRLGTDGKPVYIFQYWSSAITINETYYEMPYDARYFNYTDELNTKGKIINYIDFNSPVYPYIWIED